MWLESARNIVSESLDSLCLSWKEICVLLPYKNVSQIVLRWVAQISLPGGNTPILCSSSRFESVVLAFHFGLLLVYSLQFNTFFLFKAIFCVVTYLASLVSVGLREDWEHVSYLDVLSHPSSFLLSCSFPSFFYPMLFNIVFINRDYYKTYQVVLLWDVFLKSLNSTFSFSLLSSHPSVLILNQSGEFRVDGSASPICEILQ